MPVTFKIGDVVAVEDCDGTTVTGRIIGKSYAMPVRYDVLIDNRNYQNVEGDNIKNVKQYAS